MRVSARGVRQSTKRSYMGSKLIFGSFDLLAARVAVGFGASGGHLAKTDNLNTEKHPNR